MILTRLPILAIANEVVELSRISPDQAPPSRPGLLVGSPLGSLPGSGRHLRSHLLSKRKIF